ncbi:hypothetical protein [Aliivibrio sp. 1S128]|uniref:hypothetical protein n=1 Tax=Aliivibrio sp. 1S128 TaxID=1840085 RepID=UPI00080DF11E|nr:hypothetical protein [Aliivibrio sp. 1S128]OCH25519.1 hypothetical protein A6E03_01595 [Aliivibrio sp. 1S128]
MKRKVKLDNLSFLNKMKISYVEYYINVINKSLGKGHALKYIISELAFSFLWFIRILFPLKAAPKYIFDGIKYTDLILGLKKNEVGVFCCNIGEFVFCIRNRITILPLRKVNKLISLSKGDIDSIDMELIASVVNKNFDKISVIDTKAIIIQNTSWIRERELVNFCTRKEMYSIGIQHGLIQSSMILADNECDKLLVYDNYQRDVYLGKGADVGNIDVFQFYSNMEKYPIKQNKVVVWLGQPFYHYSQDYHLDYINKFNQFFNYFKLINIEVLYLPHPAEFNAPYLKDIDCVVFKSFKSYLKEIDYFFSVNSTALYEVTLSGKVAFQVMSSVIPCDDYAIPKYAHSIHVDIDLNDEFNLDRYKCASNISLENVSQHFERYIEEL